MFLKIVCEFVKVVRLVSLIIACNIVAFVSVICVFCSALTWKKLFLLEEKATSYYLHNGATKKALRAGGLHEEEPV